MGTLRRYPRFAVFFAGQGVSLIGSWMTRVALSWLMYRLTGSVMMLALVAVAGQAPVSLFALVGGALVDRWDRRIVLLVAKLVAMLLAASLALLTLSGAASVPALLALATLQGLQTAVDIPARQALLPELVTERDDLPSAIALNSTLVHAARFLGPFAAGWVITHWGEGYCFAIDALSYVAVLASLWVLPASVTPSPPRASLLEGLRDGYRYVREDQRVLLPLLLLAAISLSGWSYSVLLPDYVQQALGGGAATLGNLMAASGAGALVAAIGLAQRRTMKLERWLGVSAASVGLALVGLGVASSPWLAAAMLLVVGAGMMLLLALCNTALQLQAPASLRGRVMGFFTLASFGTLPIGNLLAGLLASHVGSRATLVASGLASLLAALLFSLRRKRTLAPRLPPTAHGSRPC